MTESSRLILTGATLLKGDQWVRQHAVVVEAGRIAHIVPASSVSSFLPAPLHEFPDDHYLVPGFIDLHIHGVSGFDVMDGTRAALQGMSRSLAAEGVTGFLATTMTASPDRIATVLSVIASVRQDSEGAAILGVHLEGPFISQAKLGAQSGDALAIPDAALLVDWQEMAQGAIKLVTLAPELPQAASLIKKLQEMNIVASIGHTNATFAETCHAIESGCSHATHLFNAMRGMHQREPGAAGALLLSNQVNAELIVDGLHLHPAMVEMTLKLKGKDSILLVTDAMRAKCMGDGDYDLGGQTVAVRSNVATLENGVLAGSTLRMPQAIKNMVQFTGCSLADAICMASYNPARVLGLEQRKGSIAEGKDADLVVMNPAGEVVMTLCGGKKVYE